MILETLRRVTGPVAFAIAYRVCDALCDKLGIDTFIETALAYLP